MIRIRFTYVNAPDQVVERADWRSPEGKAQAKRIKQRVC